MGQIYTKVIPEMNLLGNGIVKIDGCVVFVMGAVDGDTVTFEITEEKKNYKIGRIISIDSPSPHRISCDCEGGRDGCGGCCLRHISYEHEVEIKKLGVESALRRGGLGNIAVHEIVSGSPERYRNKAVFRFKDGHFGFSEEKSDSLVVIDNCLICPLPFSAIAEYTVRSFVGHAPEYLYLRQSSKNEISCVLGVREGFGADLSSFAENLMAEFPQVVGFSTKVGNHPEDGKAAVLISGKSTIREEFLGMALDVSPDSFFQVNHDIAEKLCRKVAEFAAPVGNEFGIDLYCGTGILGLSIAKMCPGISITGVEINPFAVENAKANAKLNSLSNIGFFCGDSADFAKNIYGSADFIVIDPPRAGCSDLMVKQLLRMAPERLVYVSCDPSTLSRDLKKLTEKKFRIEDVCAFDMFPRTHHVESVVLLNKVQ